ncbi:MAG: hypothetical protein WC677_00780 [Clostridia bacterium]
MIATSYSGCAVQSKPLFGEIIFADNSSSSEGIMSYNAELKKESKILKEVLYSSAEFNDEETKILLTVSDLKISNEKYNFFEFEVSKGTLIPIDMNHKKASDEISNVRYVPNSKSISFIRDGFMYIYNPDTRIEKKIDDVDRFTWSKDGSHFLYSPSSGVIDIYDVKTKKSKFLFNGSDPEYSKDNKYVAYKSVRDDVLCVKELKTGMIWTYNTKDPVWNYRFSPDGNYIGILKHDNSSFDSSSSTLIAWDFKNNDEINLYPEFPGGYDFDWIKGSVAK